MIDDHHWGYIRHIYIHYIYVWYGFAHTDIYIEKIERAAQDHTLVGV